MSNGTPPLVPVGAVFELMLVLFDAGEGLQCCCGWIVIEEEATLYLVELDTEAEPARFEGCRLELGEVTGVN